MKKVMMTCCIAILASILACTGFAEGTGEGTTNYRAEESLRSDGMVLSSQELVKSHTESQIKEVQTQMKMKIGDTPVAVAWESNESVEALKALAQNGLTIQMSMYGGFEQVGAIGQRLPSHDVQTHTSSGDIVLYSSSQLVVFYGSNSWAYTRLGRITDQSVEEMRALLSRGDVTITITVE